MPNIRKRRGTASEHQVVGQLLDAGIDVYQTIVDDQGIDAVLRVQTGKTLRYFDLQIKSARTWNGIRGKISALGTRDGTVLILFNSSSHECLWFDAEAIAEHFADQRKRWGDVFLTAERVAEFRAQGRGDLAKLLERLRTPQQRANHNRER
jgi:hypothetical protein